MDSPRISIIVPVKAINTYILEHLVPALSAQTCKDFELIILPDEETQQWNLPDWVRIIPTGTRGPGEKRNRGAALAKGRILAFIDDDAYPSTGWLEIALPYFKDRQVAGVCGPGVTPPQDTLLQQVSGWMWSSWLGAGGAGTYRCSPSQKREVDDYPTFNLLVRTEDFEKAGGFDSHYWPGEDTMLCHELVYGLNKKIVYDPKILVYHHRRPIFRSHLEQISRYGLHRGYFVKTLPRTSLRLGYFIPLIFTLSLLGTPLLLSFLYLFKQTWLSPGIEYGYAGVIVMYGCLLCITAGWTVVKSRQLLAGILIIPTILFSHIVYGLYFGKGLLSNCLKQ